jgi:chaperonin cofactor prefoldin
MTRLSPRSIETLIDLVEIKLSCLDVQDREDREELKALQRSLAELQEFRRNAPPIAAQSRNRTSAPALA